jgi:DNA-binding transcriptional LysR family regulator
MARPHRVVTRYCAAQYVISELLLPSFPSSLQRPSTVIPIDFSEVAYPDFRYQVTEIRRMAKPSRTPRLVDLTHLRTFVAVTRERSLTRAAEYLRISQPAASAHIRALEEQFHVQLFNRTGRGLDLTPVGRTLLPRAEELLSLALDFSSTFTKLAEGVGGPVYIGSNADPGLSRVGPFIGELRNRLPLIEPHVRLQSAHATRQELRDGELDFGFLAGAPADDNLVYKELATIVFRVTGPMQWRERILQADRSELAKMPWIITPPGNANSDMMRELFQEHGLEPRVVAEANNDLLIRSLICQGIGLSLVRNDYATQAEAEGTMSISPAFSVKTALMFSYARARKDEALIHEALVALCVTWSDADFR